MPFTITQFRSEISKQKNLARPNLYEVNVTGKAINNTLVPFMAKIATIPPSTMGVVEVPYFGRQVKVPGNRTFDNLSITILNDENFSIRNKIEEWMSQMNSHVGNVQTETLAALTTNTTVSIKHYGVAGGNDSLGEWKFINCFPVALGEIALDWGSNDTVEEYTVDWAYDYWTHAGGAGSS